MARSPVVLLIVFILLTAPMLSACSAEPPAAPPEPIEILKQANAAAAKLSAVTYQAKFYGDGTFAAQVPNMEGKVSAKRDSNGKQNRFRIDGSIIEQGSAARAAFGLAFDGTNLYSTDHSRRTYASGLIENGMGVSNPLFQPKYLHDAPYEEELRSGAPEYQGVQDVDGVACDVIVLRLKGAMPAVTKLFLGKADRLLRRFETTIQAQNPAAATPTAPAGRVIFTARSLVLNPDLRDDIFSLDCPDGFQKQPLQISRAPQGSDQQSASLATGSPAPDWELTTSDGKTVSLKSLRGKVVVLDFWATWCGPCKMAMPGIQKLHERFKDKPVAVFGVNCRERLPNANPMAYIKEKGYTYPQLLRGESAADAYKVNGLPSLFVIDPDGKILYSVSGFSPAMENVLAEIIQKAMKK